MSNPALAATCALPGDVAALKTAVIQQELMVAALQCRETGAYNRFVIAYRGELQSLDANMKAFFARRGGQGEAGYDTFKTKAANLSALREARNARAFCADARALFLAAQNHQGSLASFVEARSGIDIGNSNICAEPVLLQPIPSGAQVKPAPALIRTAGVQPAEIGIGGVPDYQPPAMPYRPQSPARAAAPPTAAVRQDNAASVQESDAQGSAAMTNGQEAPRPPYSGPPNRADDNRGTAVVKPAGTTPADVAVGGVPDHNMPAIPFEQMRRDRVAARENEGPQYNAPRSTADDEAYPPPRPRFYGPRYGNDYDRRYEERTYRAYYPPPRAGIPFSLWQQQGWQARREYPRPRYDRYPSDYYRGW
jgi:hypothetical protein